jgi:hypothetical protein
MSAGILVLVLAQGLAGCSGSRFPSTPSAPSPVPQPAPQPTGIQVNGLVYDYAFWPVAGASVEVLDGPQAGTSAITDARGVFSLTGTFDDTTRFRAAREGYVAATGTLDPNTCASCSSSRSIYFYLAVLAPAVDIAGDYTLTFIADNTCTALPNELRTRRYVATITPSSSPDPDLPNLPANTAFDVTVSGAPFLENYNRGLLYVAGDHLKMWIGDVEPGLVELVAANTYFGIGPVGASASVGTPVSTISTSLNGWMDYCVLPSAMGSSYSCGPKATAHARCQSNNHRLILTRR